MFYTLNGMMLEDLVDGYLEQFTNICKDVNVATNCNNFQWYSMYKDDKSYSIILKLPGCKKETISAEVVKQMLTIKATPAFNLEGKTFSKGEELSNKEIVKTFSIEKLIDDYDVENLKASYVDGVLTIDFQKIEPTVKKVQIV